MASAVTRMIARDHHGRDAGASARRPLPQSLQAAGDPQCRPEPASSRSRSSSRRPTATASTRSPRAAICAFASARRRIVHHNGQRSLRRRPSRTARPSARAIDMRFRSASKGCRWSRGHAASMSAARDAMRSGRRQESDLRRIADAATSVGAKLRGGARGSGKEQALVIPAPKLPHGHDPVVSVPVCPCR